MLFSYTPLLAAAASLTAVSAAPIEERQAPFEITLQAPWNSGAVTEFQIHPSCNASQRLQIQTGLNEAVQLAQHAKEHVLRWGNSSDIFRKYFGANAPTFEAIGAYDIIVNGDRGNALFRCDDPDGNCALMPTWAGHWRGSNASMETVICPPSFFLRRPLSTVCAQGYNVREFSRVLFWASDLLHRLFHVPAFGQGYIDHYAEGYDGILEAAEMGSPNATHDSDGLQYFALEAYAFDVVLPGVGCPGPSGMGTTTGTTTATPTATPTMTPTATPTATATASTLPDNCHTHANGDVHCT